MSRGIHPVVLICVGGGSLFCSCVSVGVPDARDAPELDGEAVAFVLLDLAQQSLPEVAVFDLGADLCLPGVPHPVARPRCGALDHVFRVGGHNGRVEALGRPRVRAQGRQDGAELGAVVGLHAGRAKRAPLLQAARKRLQFALPVCAIDEGPGTAGLSLAIAQASAVGEDEKGSAIIPVAEVEASQASAGWPGRGGLGRAGSGGGGPGRGTYRFPLEELRLLENS